MKSKFSAILLILHLLLFIPSTIYSISVPDRPSDYVVDLAGVINDNVEASLNRYLRELEEKTSSQMVVLTLNSLEGESIEDLSISIAHDKWRLGQKGKDNGVLMLIAMQERKYRIEVGYGLEGVLPDSFAGSVGRQYLAPYFKKGDYSTGILTASLAVISEIATDAGVEITGMPSIKQRSSSRVTRGEPTLGSKILAILFVIGLIYMFIRHPRLLMLLIMMSMMGGGRRGGGFGGSGGFGGGGGGGFGGGGASGGW